MIFEPLESHEHTFDTILGQDLVKRFLLRACEHNRLPQALLFCGPAGVGKRSLLFALAKHLVCRDFEPGSAAAERAAGKVARGTHPDVLIIEPQSASGQILRAQVDEMHERAHYAPLESSRRVILINPVEAMNLTAANNLLKLLEEPPPALYLLLECRRIHHTLATVRSRCSLLRCTPVEHEILRDWLMEKAGAPQRSAETAARLSGGKPGLALSLLSGQDVDRRRRISAELVFFHDHGYPAIFRVGRNLIEMAGGSDEAQSALLLWFRDLLVTCLTASENGRPEDDLLINLDLADEVVRAATRHSLPRLARALDVLLGYQAQTTSPFVDADLLLEVLLTRLGMALKSA